MKTTIYIDHANVFHSLDRIVKRKVDYIKLSDWIHRTYDVAEMRAYCTFTQREATDKKSGYTKFLKFLTLNGYWTAYGVVDSHHPRISWVSQITIDATMDRSDHLVFFTNDADFIPLYKWLRYTRKKKVTVLAVTLSLAVQEAIDEYVELPNDLYLE